jgi:YesN/AraC family two-component response regulator
MNYIELYSLPKIHFAHTHSRRDYYNELKPKENYLEIAYVVDGEIQIEIDNKQYIAVKNDVVCLFRNKKTHITTTGPHSHHTVAAHVEWKYIDSPTSGLFIPVVTSHSLDTDLICKHIDDFIYGHNSYEESISKNAYKFLKILTEIDYCNRSTESYHLHSEWLYAERAKTFIHKKIHEPLTQKQVAHFLGISPGYLCAVFKKIQGITLIQYINKVKLEAIRQIMEREHLKLYEASSMFGYSDPNYVSRLYKKMFEHNISEKPKKS